jgi:Fumarylacetoacetate (FAA) hydrolase family
MRLCMFAPIDHPMERGWVGRVDGDRVIHLAAQTLQSFFTGGGKAREHDVYRLDEVSFRAPVLHPPSVRLFDTQNEFAFTTSTAIRSPGETVERGAPLTLLPRLAAVIAAEQIAGFSILAELRDPTRHAPKDRDFALVFGPVVVTLDELGALDLGFEVRVDGKLRASARFADFDWATARELAAYGTRLRTGDLLAGPPAGIVEGVWGAFQVDVEGIGLLHGTTRGQAEA